MIEHDCDEECWPVLVYFIGFFVECNMSFHDFSENFFLVFDNFSLKVNYSISYSDTFPVLQKFLRCLGTVQKLIQLISKVHWSELQALLTYLRLCYPVSHHLIAEWGKIPSFVFPCTELLQVLLSASALLFCMG